MKSGSILHIFLPRNAQDEMLLLMLVVVLLVVNNFEVIYQRWISRDGNNAHMYHAQRTLVIEELAEYVRAGELARYDAALGEFLIFDFFGN